MKAHYEPYGLIIFVCREKWKMYILLQFKAQFVPMKTEIVKNLTKCSSTDFAFIFYSIVLITSYGKYEKSLH